MIFSADIYRLAQSAVLCWLATVDKKGQPNVSPKEVWILMDSNQLLIANIASPQSVRNIRECPSVCISFVDIFRQKGYQLKGKAVIYSERDSEFTRLAEPLRKIAGEAFPFSQLICAQIETVKPILAPSYVLYPDDTTEASQIEAARGRYGVEGTKALD